LLPRLGAYLIDITLVVVASWFLSFVVLMTGALVALGATGGDGFSFSTDGEEGVGVLILVAYYLLSFLPPLAYFVLLPASKGGFNGRTIGKRAVGLRVISADGTTLAPAAARRRGLAFFGPTLGALLVGAVIDGLAGLPLIVTGILTVAAAIYTTTDLTFAPAGSEYRATLHDRFAKTVVVLSGPAYTDPTDQPAPIAPRPRTGRLNLLNVIGGLYLLVIVVSIIGVIAIVASGNSGSDASEETAALIEETYGSVGDSSTVDSAEADASSTESSDPASESSTDSSDTISESTDDAESEPVGTGKATLREGATPQSYAEANAKSAAGAQRQASGAAVLIANCIGRINDYYSCGGGLGPAEFEADFRIEGSPTRSTPTKGRSAVITKPISTVHGETTVLVYDRNDIGWGYRFRESDHAITPVCLSFAANCEATKAYARFVADRAALQKIKRMFLDPVG
jgi:uncharacterized RDD family membrane protein YckC